MSIRNIIGGKSSAVSKMLNIVGMAMAFAALYVIMVQVNFDLGYNKKVKDSDRIYAISMPDWYTPGNWKTTLSRPLCENVINNVSCVECGGTTSIGKGYYSEKFFLQEDGNSSFYLNVSQSSLGAFKVFNVEAVEGSIDNIVPWKDLVISDTKAEKLGLHVGDVIYSHNHGATMQQYNIAAIYKHFPSNTDLSEIECFVNMGDLNIDLFSEWSYPYFVKLNSADDIEPFEKQAFDYVVKTFNNMANEHGEELSEEDRKEAESRLKIKLFPFDEMYFEKTISSAGRSGSKTTTYTLLAIAILVIVIAFINFINFFFALVPVRLKSVNTRKILGASRSNLVFGIVVESVVMIIVALALAAGIVKLFCGSTFAALIPCSALISNNIAIAFGTALGGIVLAIISSLYPALYITAFPPAFALKGSFGTASKGMAFRVGLICFQFIVSLILIICASFVTMQRQYMLHYDMGFDRSNLLQVNTSSKIAAMRESATSELKNNPEIKDVTFASGDIVTSFRMDWGRPFKGEQINFKCYPVQHNFLDFMGIEIVEGRNFTDSDELCDNGVFIFNEAARDKYGLTLEDKIHGHQTETDIVGICKNFNYKALSEGIEPFALYIFGKNPWTTLNTLYIRTQPGADIPTLIDWIKTKLNEMDPSVPKEEFDVMFFDSRLDSEYGRERNTSRIILLFTVLAITISLMGVFGLVMFEAEHRRKEIAIRRINGASVVDVLKMFNIKFIRIVIVCFVLSIPISWLIVDAYLKGFAYRMPTHWWVFFSAFLSVMIVTLIVVTLRCLSAALSNPIKSIKTE
ncbi:MAG: ABC transporter permease [Bacteroidales bacterium]|nr:ABC transporter permease [Bacteroidales bacterium]